MGKKDISQIAQNTLAELILLKGHAEREDLLLDDVLAEFIENVNCEGDKELDEFIAALQELKNKGYIDINIELPVVPKIDSVKINKAGKKHAKKYLRQNGKWIISERNKKFIMEENLSDLSKSGYYIVIVGLLTLACEIINTVINIISASN